MGEGFLFQQLSDYLLSARFTLIAAGTLLGNTLQQPACYSVAPIRNTEDITKRINIT